MSHPSHGTLPTYLPPYLGGCLPFTHSLTHEITGKCTSTCPLYSAFLSTTTIRHHRSILDNPARDIRLHAAGCRPQPQRPVGIEPLQHPLTHITIHVDSYRLPTVGQAGIQHRQEGREPLGHELRDGPAHPVLQLLHDVLGRHGRLAAAGAVPVDRRHTLVPHVCGVVAVRIPPVVDIDADPHKKRRISLPRVLDCQSRCVAEHAADLVAVQQHVIDPLDLAGDAECVQCVRHGESGHLRHVEEQMPLLRRPCSHEGRVHVAAGRVPPPVVPQSDVVCADAVGLVGGAHQHPLRWTQSFFQQPVEALLRPPLCRRQAFEVQPLQR
mmetsp:Transcript_44637/g.126180  ORF Transcript_44637/g.126180 Transcript_44637/m.126180 type:complete len:325 (+) Transcript_44637:121-1095(+)